MSSMMQHPHLDVHLFEANTELKERGASVGLCGNAQRALSLLGLPDVVQRAKGVRVASFRLVVVGATRPRDLGEGHRDLTSLPLCV